jgi:predicted NBD/HSP70 family sugar kinase
MTLELIIFIASIVFGIIFKTTKIIDNQSESLEDKLEEVLEKGKDFIEDLQAKNRKEERKRAFKRERTFIGFVILCLLNVKYIV